MRNIDRRKSKENQESVKATGQNRTAAVVEEVGMEARPHLFLVASSCRLMREDAEDIHGALGVGAGRGTSRPTVTAAAKTIAGDTGVISTKSGRHGYD